MGKNPKFSLCSVRGLSTLKKNMFRFGLSSVNIGFGLDSVPVVHQWNWKDVSMEVICYGLTVIISTS